MQMKNKISIAILLLATSIRVYGDFAIDKTVMNDKYWLDWGDEFQAKIDADIEANRKADAVVGIPAPEGTSVQVEQISHKFFFGAHIFNYNQLGKKEWQNVANVWLHTMKQDMQL